MAGMNIDELKKTVLLGQISTLKNQIMVLETYQERANVDVTDVVAAINAHIDQLQSMIDAL